MALLEASCPQAHGFGIGTGYHGFHNFSIAAESPALGCIDERYIKLSGFEEVIEVLQKWGAGIDYVLVEPVELDPHVKPQLQEIKRLCHLTNTILIFDEVITAGRFPQGTVARTFDVWPDLMTCGKGLGGGYCLGAVVGPHEVMDIPEVFVSGTFCGELTKLEGLLKTLTLLTREKMRQFYDQCNDFQEKLAYVTSAHLVIKGYGTRIVIKDHDEGMTSAKLMQEMYREHQILLGPVMLPKISWAGREFTLLITAIESVLRNIDHVTLQGEPPRPVFKRNKDA